MARVSIIMGVYNSERTLAKCLDSIITQTYEDWYFIICDDGSSDGSWTVLNEYKRLYPHKFFLIRNKENKGLTYSLNMCLNYVNSDYVARMDSDDESLPKRLQYQINFLDTHAGFDFVGCCANKFDETGIWGEFLLKEFPNAKDLLWNSPFIHPTIVIRTDVLNAVHGYRDVWYTKRCEDYDLWLRLYAKGIKGCNIPVKLFNYYEGKNSFVKRKYSYRINEAITRMIGFWKLKLFPLGLPYIVKPLIVGVIPNSVLKRLKKQRGK